MTNFGFGNFTNVAKINQKQKESTNLDKINKKDSNSRTDSVKDRELLAGTKQVESKLRKEELPKTIERYKAFKSAYQYQLGEKPYEEEEIEENLKSKKISKKEENKEEKPIKLNLEEIEQYKEPRNKFKSKLKYFLGEDFNEEAPYQEENLNSLEKIEDSKEKIKLAIESYNTLIEYISNFLGSFDFDNINDLKTFLEQGMPEDAIIKFITLHQLTRSDIYFPSILDLSIILDKLNDLNIKVNIDDLNKNIDNDFGTTKKLKYTIAGFIYIPLQEVMNNIIRDSKLKLTDYINKILEKYSIDYIEEFNGKISEEVVNEIISLSKIYYSELIDLYYKKQDIINKLPKIKNVSENDKKEIENLDNQISLNLSKIKNFEIDISKLIYLYFYLNSNKNILEYNEDLPIDSIRNVLIYCRINIENDIVDEIINQKMRYNIFLDEKIKDKKNIVQTDFFDNKLKSSLINFQNKNTQKQTEFIKKSRLDDFETQNIIFWYKQNYLKEFKKNFIELEN
jgi:hypothetical protein